MGFVIGNTLQLSPSGHIVEYDHEGCSIGMLEPALLSAEAQAALAAYLSLYQRTGWEFSTPGEDHATSIAREQANEERSEAVRAAAWRVAFVIWADRVRAAASTLLENLNAAWDGGWAWDKQLAQHDGRQAAWSLTLVGPDGAALALHASVFGREVVLQLDNGLPAETLLDAAPGERMLSVRALHRQGMAAHDRVLVARLRRQRPGDRDLLAAWREEARAAALVVRTCPADRSSEPTRGVLCRSAAWMALDCGFLDAATWLVQTGRAGQPYADTQAELDECQAAIDVARDHLARRAAPPASMDKEPV